MFVVTELLATADALPLTLTLALALTEGNTKELALALMVALALALALALCFGPVQNFWKNDCPLNVMGDRVSMSQICREVFGESETLRGNHVFELPSCPSAYVLCDAGKVQGRSRI